MATSETLREKVEQLEAENRELKTESKEAPNFSDPSSVIKWHGKQIIRYLSLMRREKASSRLRLLNTSIDSWSRAFRLCADTSELEGLKRELDELREMVIESSTPEQFEAMCQRVGE